MIRLETVAEELNAYVITLSFYDHDNSLVAPDTLSWSLYDMRGNIINSRTAVEVSAPTNTEDFVLSGNDLAVNGTSIVERILMVTGTYTHGEHGSGLAIGAEVLFCIQPRVIPEYQQ